MIFICWGLNLGPQTWEVSALPWSCIYSSGFFLCKLCITTIHGLRTDENETGDG